MVTKKDLVRKIAKNMSMTQVESDIVLNGILDIIIEELRAGNDVNLVGFGKFYMYEHTPRPVRNPKTQETMILDPYKSMKFKSSNVLKANFKALTQKK